MKAWSVVIAADRPDGVAMIKYKGDILKLKLNKIKLKCTIFALHAIIVGLPVVCWDVPHVDPQVEAVHEKESSYLSEYYYCIYVYVQL